MNLCLTCWICLFVPTFNLATSDVLRTGWDLPNKILSLIRQKRITGGENAEKGAYPWQVGVVFYSTGNVECSGAIITGDLVLTAAHCLSDPRPEYYIIVAGDHDIKSQDGTEQYRWVIQVIQHSLYVPGQNLCDIGLIKISGKFHYNQNVQPVALAIPSQDHEIEANENLYCVVTGWGNTKPGAEPSKSTILQVAALSVISNQECRRFYSAAISDDMICTQAPGLKTPCQGDGGDPLVCFLERKWTLVGIATWSRSNCYEPDVPSVNTRVSYFHEWINSYIS